MNYGYKKMIMVMLQLSALLLSTAVQARGLEVVRSDQGKLEFVQVPENHTQPVPIQAIKKPVASVSATHEFIKNYGLTIASVASMFIPKKHQENYVIPLGGAIAGAALGAIINDTDRLKGAACAGVLGAATGKVMAMHSPYKSILLRATHGAILNTESCDVVVSGATCGLFQGSAEMAIAKMFAYKYDNPLGPIPATLCSAALLASIGMPKKISMPTRVILFDFSANAWALGRNLPAQTKSRNAGELLAGDTLNSVAMRTTQHLVATRIREKFTELETKYAQTAHDKKMH